MTLQRAKFYRTRAVVLRDALLIAARIALAKKHKSKKYNFQKGVLHGKAVTFFAVAKYLEKELHL